jgi:uncharacterized protein YjbI with pentapeptide repeats
MLASAAHLEVLEQGVEVWNQWRSTNPEIDPDLFGADFKTLTRGPGATKGASLLSSLAMLREIDLHRADLRYADCRLSNLSKANLREANLSGANLSSANASGANFAYASLNGADLNSADLTGADFSNCFMQGTEMGNIDLRQCHGLETVIHQGPSTIGIDTIYRSGGNIPEAFLRGAGVPEDFIIFKKSLVGKPIEFYSCFISYSSKDQEFAERLNADLRGRNVRCWFAPEDLKIGDRLRPSFDEAIRVHDKLMVLLSENSVSSPWVEKEVETAFEKERREKRTVLFPIRLDDGVMETNETWAADIRRGRHIGDFRDWKNHDAYKKAFDRLLRDLKAEG